jgi:hypothetical protein
MIAVVKREAKQSTLLWCCEESEQTAQGIAKTVKTEIGPACPNVADEIAAAVLKPILQPIRDHLGLHIEFVLVLIVAVLLCGSSPQNLHRLTGYPVVLQQKLAEVMNPLARKDQALVEQATVLIPSAELHQLSAATKGGIQEHFNF